ncbi:ZIP family metal transporter [Microbacterium sp. NPDC057659]|uniref:ZIP family metal transporter n=1 Tax=Microbacterium sp. NPDC057659 TaxID=3346198 RepID=UPI00366E7CA4
MGQAWLWGAVAAAPLFLGALLSMVRTWPPKLLGIVLGFGAGALISSISFELVQEGLGIGGPMPLVGGLAVGALTYYVADRIVDARAAAAKGPSGMPLAVGALLDGIPEQLVLGIGLASGDGVSLALVIAILVSNLPESIGSASDLLASGMKRGRMLALWAGVTVICMLSTVAGYAITDAVGPAFQAAVDGFAAGALLVMLVDSMVPEAQSKAQESTGLFTVLGFTVAAGLSFAG